MGMGLMSPRYMADLLDTAPEGFAKPNVFIETGMHLGNTARIAAPYFRVVHTIEILPHKVRRFLQSAVPRNVRVHEGNSAEILPRLLAAHDDEPIMVYLDAHWMHQKGRPGNPRGDDPTQLGAADFPLWDELAALRPRGWRDCVVVDDLNLMGRDNGEFPWPTDPRWRDTSPDRIVEALGGDEALAYRGSYRDALVLWRAGA